MHKQGTFAYPLDEILRPRDVSIVRFVSHLDVG